MVAAVKSSLVKGLTTNTKMYIFYSEKDIIDKIEEHLERVSTKPLILHETKSGI